MNTLEFNRWIVRTQLFDEPTTDKYFIIQFNKAITIGDVNSVFKIIKKYHTIEEARRYKKKNNELIFPIPSMLNFTKLTVRIRK